MVSKQWTPSNSGANLGRLCCWGLLACDVGASPELFEPPPTADGAAPVLLSDPVCCNCCWAEERGGERLSLRPKESAQRASKELKIDIIIFIRSIQEINYGKLVKQRERDVYKAAVRWLLNWRRGFIYSVKNWMKRIGIVSRRGNFRLRGWLSWVECMNILNLGGEVGWKLSQICFEPKSVVFWRLLQLA